MARKTLFGALLCAAVAVLGPACSCGSTACGPGNCPGCCDSTGTCQSGLTSNACGEKGAACEACPINQSCLLATCVPVTQGGDGGPGGGGDGGPGDHGDSGVIGRDAGPVGGDGGHPNVLIMIDTSGSMVKPMDATLASCQTGNASCPACGFTGCGAPLCDTSVCPTRISALQSALETFMSQFGSDARFGLVIFPKLNGGSCDPAGVADLSVPVPATDDPAALQTNASKVAMVVQGITPVGGTPTAATLAGFAGYSGLTDPTRADYVLLLTDGEPNCNAANPNLCTSTACDCTFFSGLTPPPGSCPGSACACGVDTTNPNCALGCLDATAAGQATQGLLVNGIKTFVLGVGPETLPDAGVGTGFAPGALQEMAQGGGEVRACPTGSNVECGVNDTCNLSTLMCNRAYYQGSSVAELEAALTQILQHF